MMFFILTIGTVVNAAVISTEVLLNQNLIITYNDEVQRFKNVKGDVVYPISFEGTTYLPIRSISCLFETEIEWDGNTNSIFLGKGSLDTISAESIPSFIAGTDQNIMVDLNQDIKIYHNNEIQTFKDVNGKVVYPLSYQGTTYLPVRAISNLYNAKIEWIGETSTVAITKKDEIELAPDSKRGTFELKGYSSTNGVVDYSTRIDEEYVQIKAKEHNLPTTLYNYKEDILLDIVYTKKLLKGYEVQTCAVINRITNERITDLSEENLKRLFDIEYGKTIENQPWVEKISLSELSLDTIYKYTATSTANIPEIINNTGNDCLVYTKIFSNSWHDDDPYEKEIYLFNKIKSNAFSFSYNEFEPGESMNIMYKPVTTEEILKLIDESEIIRLNGYKPGDKLEYDFEDYLYNDTENDIILIANDTSWGIESSNTVTVEAGRIYQFDWMINSVTVK